MEVSLLNLTCTGNVAGIYLVQMYICPLQRIALVEDKQKISKNKIEVLNRSFNDTNSGKLKRQSRRNASLSSADVAARVRSSTQAGTREPRKASCADFKYRGPTM